MHTPKFKTGDVVAVSPKDPYPYTFTIIEIVFGSKEVIGNWGYNSVRTIKDSYVVTDNGDGLTCFIGFEAEHEFHLLNRPNNITMHSDLIR